MSTDRNCGPAFTAEFIDKHLDNVLKASGSAIRHYSMTSTKFAMRKAMEEAMIAAREASQ